MTQPLLLDPAADVLGAPDGHALGELHGHRKRSRMHAPPQVDLEMGTKDSTCGWRRKPVSGSAALGGAAGESADGRREQERA